MENNIKYAQDMREQLNRIDQNQKESIVETVELAKGRKKEKKL